MNAIKKRKTHTALAPGIEAENHRILAKLLNTEWAPEYKKELDAILSSPGSVSDKIAQIAKIDARRRFAGNVSGGILAEEPESERKQPQAVNAENEPKPSNGGEENRQNEKPTANIVESTPMDKPAAEKGEVLPRLIAPAPGSRELIRNQLHIKKEHAVQTIFSYIFFELGKIKEFGLSHRVISTGFWGFKLRMSPESERVFKSEIQLTLVPRLKGSLQAVLQKGWLYLGKYDYNLLALLNRFCDSVLKANYQAGNHKTMVVDNDFRKAEITYLVFQAHPDFGSRASDAMRAVYKELPQDKSEKLADPRIIHRLMGAQGNLPSLHDIILGINMLTYRRYLLMSDLLNNVNRPLVSSTDYDCTDEIRREIEEFLRGQIELLETLSKELHEIVRLRGYIPAPSRSESSDNMQNDIAGESDFETLEFVYNGSARFTSYLFAKDKDNCLVFCSRFIEVFLDTFTGLLDSGLRIAPDQRVKIFNNHTFNNELARLQYCFIRMQKLVSSFPSFPRKRYLTLKYGQDDPTTFEAEAMSSFAAASETFAQLGLGMADIIRNRSKSSGPDSVSTKSYPIPHETATIASPGILRGKTVIEALTLLTTSSLLMAHWLAEPGISYKLQREAPVREKIVQILATVERIGSENQFVALRETYRLL